MRKRNRSFNLFQEPKKGEKLEELTPELLKTVLENLIERISQYGDAFLTERLESLQKPQLDQMDIDGLTESVNKMVINDVATYQQELRQKGQKEDDYKDVYGAFTEYMTTTDLGSLLQLIQQGWKSSTPFHNKVADSK